MLNLGGRTPEWMRVEFESLSSSASMVPSASQEMSQPLMPRFWDGVPTPDFDDSPVWGYEFSTMIRSTYFTQSDP